jgi:hypothetical protein
MADFPLAFPGSQGPVMPTKWGLLGGIWPCPDRGTGGQGQTPALEPLEPSPGHATKPPGLALVALPPYPLAIVRRFDSETGKGAIPALAGILQPAPVGRTSGLYNV